MQSMMDARMVVKEAGIKLVLKRFVVYTAGVTIIPKGGTIILINEN